MDSCIVDQPRSLDSENTGFLNVTPLELKFSFDSKDSKEQRKIVEITNHFSRSCPVRLLPLETRDFRVIGTNSKRWLSPGSVLKVNVLFVPSEARNYNDVLGIRYGDNKVLSVKISAHFVTKFSFPTVVDFGNVPLGKPVCHEIPIRPCLEKKFTFAILPNIEDPSIDIYPRWGCVKPGQEPTMIMVIYRPLRYVSFNFEVRIFVSDFCNTPYSIHFRAYTRPSLLRDTLDSVDEKQIKKRSKTMKDSKKRISSVPVKMAEPKFPVKESKDSSVMEHYLLKELDRLPSRTLHSINCFLNSKFKETRNEHELRGPSNLYWHELKDKRSRKRREFLLKADDRRRENNRARLCRKPRVYYGARDFNPDEIIELKVRREQAWSDYKDSTITSPFDELLDRYQGRKIRQRILRSRFKLPAILPPYISSDESFLHHVKIAPFLEAARQIVLKNRLLKRLTILKTLTPEMIDRLIETKEDGEGGL